EEWESPDFVAIPYREEEIRQIAALSDLNRIWEPYVAGKGIATDYGVAAVEEEAGVIRLTYPHFYIRESASDLRPENPVSVGKTIVLPLGRAQWIAEPGGGAWYLQMDRTFLSIGTAKPYDPQQLLFVAASLIPLESAQPSPPTAGQSSPSA